MTGQAQPAGRAGGGTQAGGCGHEHATRAEAPACVEAQANAIVAGALPGCEPPGLDALR